MQSAIGRGDASSAANPALDIWIQAPIIATDGSGAFVSQLCAPTSMQWAIQCMATDAFAMSPFQVAAGTTDLVADLVTSDGSTGHYAATTAPSTWAIPTGLAALPAGHYQIVWSYVLPAGASGVPMPGKMTRDFDLLDGQTVGPGLVLSAYALVSDLREEGLRPTDATDLRLLRAIKFASQTIERWTGRYFEPRFAPVTSNGTGGRRVQFGDPLIALASLSLGNPVQEPISAGSFRLYNRHLTQRLTDPDDRDDPMIEFVHFDDTFGIERSSSVDSPLFGVPFRDLYFPRGVQNVNVIGLWGYTDWDGSGQGATPLMIRHATKLIVMREYRKMNDEDRDERKRYRLSAERTRDQSYNLQAVREGEYTGDREIDDIIATFQRPMRMAFG